MKILDCTLRDGGYYNNWNFPEAIINQYLYAMAEAKVDIVELGLRSLKNQGFKGACAYTTDTYLNNLQLPDNLTLGVMINASELLGEMPLEQVLEKLFPNPANRSPIQLVRIACHFYEFEAALEAVSWLTSQGYQVGFNLMQITQRTKEEVAQAAQLATTQPIRVLYFADSLGSMSPQQIEKTIQTLRQHWQGELGIHTHDNLGLALTNTLTALEADTTWLDATVTGMGRGPGNARTEELIIELAERRQQTPNLIPLMQLIQSYFKPLQHHHGWGTNPYYYLAGKYGIHPTYIQQMQSDARFNPEDILAVINHLRNAGGSNFNPETLNTARHFYLGETKGSWNPQAAFSDKDILILGTGPGVAEHKTAIENYIREHQPQVLALNTQTALAPEFINYRLASHPVRLLADCETHTQLPQPLITPYSMLPTNIQQALKEKEVLDFGLKVEPNIFAFNETSCIAPASLVMAYAFAIAASGKAKTIYIAGFDGYPEGDARNEEMNAIIKQFKRSKNTPPLISLTPSSYDVDQKSIYGV